MSAHETCPYRSIPNEQRWDRAFNSGSSGLWDPYVDQPPPFRFDRRARIVTAGSCFAQNIARRLRQLNYNYVMTEYDTTLPAAENETRGNTMFSARYGNIYTVAHLYQLIETVYGRWNPQENHWQVDGRFFDPYRPSMEPQGFASLADLRQAREEHLAATRNAFATCDIFIFTLGLTEGWTNRQDGATFPVCPGCGFGTFDAEKYVFKNYSLEEISRDLHRAIAALRDVNPAMKIILTVSPVPLAATMEARHVLLSTTYSKSVLRLACEAAARECPGVDYFASFEIVNWGRQMSSYFTGDLRTVSEAGIDHVMKVFFRHYADEDIAVSSAATPDESLSEIAAKKVWCDDDLLLEEGLSGPIKAQTRAIKPRDPDDENLRQVHAHKQGFRAKVFEATAQRNPHPYTGWKGVPRSNVLFGRMLDDKGYYNTRNIADFMGPEWRRICVLGPSIIMDLENPESDTICGIMQREFAARGHDHVFIYNCGIHASITGMDLSNLLHYVTDFSPDIVVAVSGGDMRSTKKGDPRPNYPESFFLWEKILKSFRVEPRDGATTAFLEDFEYDLEAMRQSAGWGSAKWFFEVLGRYQQNILKMRGLGSGFNFGCCVVNTATLNSHRFRKTLIHDPNFRALEHDALRHEAIGLSDFYRDKLAPLNQPDAFLSLDLSECMDDLEPGDVFSDILHMHAIGYQRIANRLVDEIIQGFPQRLARRANSSG